MGNFYRRVAGHIVRVLGHDFPLSRFTSAAVVSVGYLDREGGDALARRAPSGQVTRALERRPRCRIPEELRPSLQAEGAPTHPPGGARAHPALAARLRRNRVLILATSAEDAALRSALREDLTDDTDPQARVRVRGTKTAKRNRLAPIISDEQWVLLDFVRRHARGTDGRLFGPLTNFRRGLAQAAKRANIPHVWPHALRKAAGQFLVDLHVPLELVSRVMGHVDTRVTETFYARVRDEDLGDRILSAIDPKYARRTIDNLGTVRDVQTITALPEPRATKVLYEVNGVSRTLTAWAKACDPDDHALQPRDRTRYVDVRRDPAGRPQRQAGCRSRDADASAHCTLNVTR